MIIEKNDLIELNGDDYITLDVISHNNDNYAFLNKLINDEPTKEFYIYKLVPEGLVLVEEDDLRSVLLPIFTKNFQELVDAVRGNA